MKKLYTLLFTLYTISSFAQVKILFDASKGEQAGNADWVIDTDSNSICLGSLGTYYYNTFCTESNPQRIPTPAQSGITTATPETYWKGAISHWAVDCAKKGYQVESLNPNARITYNDANNPQDLKNYTIFVLCEPNVLLTTSQKTAIINFVKYGGRLFMISDHESSDRNFDGEDSRQILNDLMFNNSVQNNPFGIYFDSTDISGTYTNFPNLPSDTLLHGPFGNITQVKWSGGCTMTLNTTANSTVKPVAYKNGATQNNLNTIVAYGRYGIGKFAAFTDSSPFDDSTGDVNDVLYNGYITDAGGNHQKFIMNTTYWLATNDIAPFTARITGDTTFCAGDSTMLTATAGISYVWSNGKTTQSIYVKTSGTYRVTVTNSSAQTATASIYVKVNTNPVPVITPSGNNLTTTIYTSYQWYLNSAVISTAITKTYTPIVNGNYTVFVTDTNGCKGTSAAYSMTIFKTSISCPDTTICAGDSTLLTAGSGVSYNWSNGKTTQTIYVKTTGTYQVTVTNSTTQTATASIYVKVNSNPAPVITYNGNVFSTQLFSTYQWNLNKSLIPQAQNQSYTPSSNGVYTVFVTDTNGCKGMSDTFTVSHLGIFTTDNNYFKVYPNPTAQYICIDATNNSNEIYTISLYNIKGEKVYAKTQEITTGSNNITLPLLSNGKYYITLEGTEQKAIYPIEILH